MAHLKFSEVALCTQQDIECELGDMSELAEGVTEQEKSEVVERAINTAKILIGNNLKASLPDIHAGTMGAEYRFDDWITKHNYSYVDLDPVLDLVTDISKLKDAAVALTIVCLIKRMIVQSRASYTTALGILGDRREFWQREYYTRITEAKKILTLELGT